MVARIYLTPAEDVPRTMDLSPAVRASDIFFKITDDEDMAQRPFHVSATSIWFFNEAY